MRRNPQPDGLDIVELIRRELTPIQDALRQLTSDHATKGDVAALREEIREAKAGTYSREMLDQRNAALQGHIDDLGKQFDELKRNQLDERERLWYRLGLAISVGYTLLQVFTHYSVLFK